VADARVDPSVYRANRVVQEDGGDERPDVFEQRESDQCRDHRTDAQPECALGGVLPGNSHRISTTPAKKNGRPRERYRTATGSETARRESDFLNTAR